MVISYGRLDGPPDPGFVQAMREHHEAGPAVRFFTIHSFDDRPHIRAAANRPLFSSTLKSSLREQPVSVDTPPNPRCATRDPARACLTTGVAAGAPLPRFAGQPRPLLPFAAQRNIPLIFD
jgi:hypothetical protein